MFANKSNDWEAHAENTKEKSGSEEKDLFMLSIPPISPRNPSAFDLQSEGEVLRFKSP